MCFKTNTNLHIYVYTGAPGGVYVSVVGTCVVTGEHRKGRVYVYNVLNGSCMISVRELRGNEVNTRTQN